MVKITPKKFLLNDQQGICRLYNLDSDPEKIVLTLYTALQSEKGIAELRKQDKEYFFKSDKNFHLVAEINDELVSSVVLMFTKTNESYSVEFFSVVTNDKYQGTGVSSIMLTYAFEVVRNFDCKIVKLSTMSDNYKAQNFYVKMGFKEINRTEKEVYYELKLI